MRAPLVEAVELRWEAVEGHAIGVELRYDAVEGNHARSGTKLAPKWGPGVLGSWGPHIVPGLVQNSILTFLHTCHIRTPKTWTSLTQQRRSTERVPGKVDHAVGRAGMS